MSILSNRTPFKDPIVDVVKASIQIKFNGLKREIVCLKPVIYSNISGGHV